MSSSSSSSSITADDVANTSRDYSQYLKQDLSTQLLPVHRTVDEMLTRLEEFEALSKVVQGGDAEAFLKILACKDEIDTLRDRVDRLHVFVNRVDDDLHTLERQVDAAEAHVGVSDNRIKNILKPFLNKITKESVTANAESSASFEYKAPETFHTSDYFPS